MPPARRERNARSFHCDAQTRRMACQPCSHATAGKPTALPRREQLVRQRRRRRHGQHQLTQLRQGLRRPGLEGFEQRLHTRRRTSRLQSSARVRSKVPNGNARPAGRPIQSGSRPRSAFRLFDLPPTMPGANCSGVTTHVSIGGAATARGRRSAGRCRPRTADRGRLIGAFDVVHVAPGRGAQNHQPAGHAAQALHRLRLEAGGKQHPGIAGTHGDV